MTKVALRKKWDCFDTDDKVRFYVGLPSMEVLMVAFEHVSSHVYTANTVAQQFSRVHHCTHATLQDLACQFVVSLSTV